MDANGLVKIGEELMHWLSAGGLLTVLGMVLVFTVLVILIVVITLFGKVMTAGQKKPKVKVKKPVEVKPVIINSSAPAAPAASEDENELIAVIAAAVDAIYSGSGKKAIIRNIKPAAAGGRSAWATAGVLQNVKSF